MISQEALEEIRKRTAQRVESEMPAKEEIREQVKTWKLAQTKSTAEEKKISPITKARIKK